MLLPPPRSTLFPYTTLFRSGRQGAGELGLVVGVLVVAVGRAQGDGLGVLPREALARLREARSEEHTSELQSRRDLVCRLLLEKKKLSWLIDVVGWAGVYRDL